MTSKGVQGFGCMGWSAFYSSANSITEEAACSIFQRCIAEGVTLFNSAVFYGPLTREGYGANLRLLNKCLKSGVDRSKIQLMVKIGMDTRPPEGDPPGSAWNMIPPSQLEADVDFALEQLDTEYLDIVVLCRVNPAFPIEDSVAAMKKIVGTGKARYIGLSEASAANIKRACAVAPIYCIEQEWSLWTRDLEEEIVPVCRENGIKIVAYSPLGRGFLTNTIRSLSALEPTDWRSYGCPRFAPENIESNLALVDAAEALAARKGITMSQLSLAFLHAQGPDVIPIPGTSDIKHLEENLAARTVTLTSAELNELKSMFKNVAGDRYQHMNLTFHAQQS
jgi:aryl-alcohol dehydrogenase-like predicted oxidoreductase